MNKTFKNKFKLIQRITVIHTLTLLAVIALLLAFGGSTFSELLRYQRESILEGQLWRVLTAPLVHLNWPHTIMNTTGLIIIWGLFGPTLTNRAWVIITLVCTLCISSALLLFNPDIRWYVGLSGLLHSYFAAGAIAERHIAQRTSIVMLILITSKLIWEQLLGPLPGSAETGGGKVIVEAHMYGAISGLIFGWFLTRKKLGK